MTYFPVTVPPVDIYAGDTVTFPGYRVKNPDGSPMDLSSWTSWKAFWRDKVDEVGAELLVDTSGIATGMIVVRASSTQTRAMGRDGRFDISAQRAGETRTWIRGATRLVPDVRA